MLQNHKIISRAAITVTMLLIFLATILITVAALKIFIGSNDGKKIISETKAVNVIANYSTSSEITSLSSKAYSKQTKTPEYITYKFAGQKYDIKILAKNSLVYIPTANYQISDGEEIKKQTKSFMKKQGFNLIANNYTANTNYANYSNFENETTICMLIIRSQPLSRSFSCVDKSEAIKRYALTNQLFELYNKSTELPSKISSVDYIKAERGDVAYSIVTFYSDNKQYMLLFGFAENNWEYIGDLLNNSVKYLIGKNTITPAMKQKINNPKYKDFLSERFLG